MAETVWKFPVEIADTFALTMPRGAVVLTVATQGGDSHLCLWARCDPRAQLERRHFRLAGTGHALNADVGRYVATFQVHGGALVFHVFEIEEGA